MPVTYLHQRHGKLVWEQNFLRGHLQSLHLAWAQVLDWIWWMAGKLAGQVLKAAHGASPFWEGPCSQPDAYH